MKILVTGGAGFIGSAVVRRGIHEGHTIKNIDKLTYAACIENLKSVCDHPNYSFEKIDICNGSKLINCFNKFMPDAVMHLAAESHVDRSIDTPSIFVQSNIVGTYEILEASKKYWEYQGKPESFRFHHISTDEVYGSLEKQVYLLKAHLTTPNHLIQHPKHHQII
jgi:dTDP-glucose 4,6-dehydratase